VILLLRFASIYNLLLQFFDGLLTYQVLSLGVPEANPLVNAAIGEWGVIWGLLYWKTGVIFDPKRPMREIKQFECSEIISTSREEAEEYALTLCRAWIDGLKPYSGKQH